MPHATDGNAEDRRVFEIMPALANAGLHRHIKDLTHVRMGLDARKRTNVGGKASVSR